MKQQAFESTHDAEWAAFEAILGQLGHGHRFGTPVSTEDFPAHFFAPRYRLITDFYRHIIEGALSVLSVAGLKAVQQVRRAKDPRYRKVLH